MSMRDRLRTLAELLPPHARSRVKSGARAPLLARAVHPPLPRMLRRRRPLDRTGGARRGTPIECYYADLFVARHRSDIRGVVLECNTGHYERSTGDAIVRTDVIDTNPENDRATILGELGDGVLQPQAYDCAVVSDALRYVDNLEVALAATWDSVAPGGVLLFAMPALVPPRPRDDGADRWRMFPVDVQALVTTCCPGGIFDAETFGNFAAVQAAVSGQAAEELRSRRLASSDPRFPVVVGVRVQKTS